MPGSLSVARIRFCDMSNVSVFDPILASVQNVDYYLGTACLTQPALVFFFFSNFC